MHHEEAIVARVCHDLITPFNAISLGMEAYIESSDSSILDEVRKSVCKANTILKFMRELYSLKPEAYYYSQASLGNLVSEFLLNCNIEFQLNSKCKNISNYSGKIVMYNAIVAKEIMPFGGIVAAEINESCDKIVSICSGNNISELDLDENMALDHKSIIRHCLLKLLKEYSFEISTTKNDKSLTITEKCAVT
jgi:hypothetical protein